jgi:ketosteroid isomerase-like protein
MSIIYYKKLLKRIIVPAFFIISNSIAAQTKNADIEMIKSYRAASNAAIAAHNVNGISKFWLDDFVQVIGRGTYETGKENIAASWKTLFDSNAQVSYVRNPEEIIISDNDTLAWESGKWIGIHTYSKGGNYAAMWIKRNDVWMLKAELFVSLEVNKQKR